MDKKPVSCSDRSLPLPQGIYNDTWDFLDFYPTSVQENAAIAPPQSSLPETSIWPGAYNFNVSFENPEKNTKQMCWKYSELENKLYVKKDASCKISFSTNVTMFQGVYIRATVFYKSPESAMDPVARCVGHSYPEIVQNVFEAKHLIRSESLSAEYLIDPGTNHHSVIVPFENPPAGQSFSTYVFKFLCFSSCPGGPNRRPLVLVFTLEKGNSVLGRISMDLKVCSSPGQCRKNTENSSPPIKKQKKSQEISVPDIAGISIEKEREKQKPEKRKFVIKVKDKDCYLFLKQMKRLYKMHGSVEKYWDSLSQLKLSSSKD